MPHSPYLYQSREWNNFWLQSHNHLHKSVFVDAHHTTAHTNQRLSIGAYIYIYPWHFGHTLIHIPAGPYITTNSISSEEADILVRDFFNKVIELSQIHNSVAIHIDFDSHFGTLLEMSSSTELLELIKRIKLNSPSLTRKSKINMMFSQVAVLSIASISVPRNDERITPQYLENKIAIDKDFWLNVSETTRKQSRKSTRSGFVFDTTPTLENIHSAYTLLESTARRQHFSIPTYDFFVTLSQQGFFEFLLIKDNSGLPHLAWIGLKNNDCLTNLYAGNDDISLTHFLPNLAHLYGIYRARQLGLEWYDLGGYNKDGSKMQFKNGYKPTIINFPGPIDIVIKPLSYFTISFLQSLKKRLS